MCSQSIEVLELFAKDKTEQIAHILKGNYELLQICLIKRSNIFGIIVQLEKCGVQDKNCADSNKLNTIKNIK